MRKEEDSSFPLGVIGSTCAGAFDTSFESLAGTRDLLFFFLVFTFFLSLASDLALLGVLGRFFLEVVLTLLQTDLADISTSEDITEIKSSLLVAVLNSEMLWRLERREEGRRILEDSPMDRRLDG